MDEIEYNPFMPDNIVDFDRFAGRKEEIIDIEKVLKGISVKERHNILIKGEKWIGKSSLVYYIQHLSNKLDTKEIGNYYYAICGLGGCRNIEDICAVILKEFQSCKGIKEHFKDKAGMIKGFNFSAVGIGGGIDIERKEKEDIIPNFPYVMDEILKAAKSKYKGFIIALDETEKIAKKEYFGSFLKNLIEVLHGKGHRNFCMILTVTPKGLRRCIEDHQSFTRLFLAEIELKRLDNNESKDLIRKALRRGRPKKKITRQAIETLIEVSDGIPGFLQEIGYHCFKYCNDYLIRREDVVLAIQGDTDHLGAIDTIYRKHFQTLFKLTDFKNIHLRILRAFLLNEREMASPLIISHRCQKEGKYKKVEFDLAFNQLMQWKIIERVPEHNKYLRITSTMLKIWLNLKLLPIKKRGKT